MYPNSTHIYQPADVCLFRGLKAAWNTGLEGLGYQFDYTTKRLNFPVLLKLVTQKYFTPELIRRAFECCGLYPWNPDAIDYSKCLSVSVGKDNDDAAVDDPEVLGVEASNQMMDDIRTVDSIGVEHDQPFRTGFDHLDDEATGSTLNSGPLMSSTWDTLGSLIQPQLSFLDDPLPPLDLPIPSSSLFLSKSIKYDASELVSNESNDQQPLPNVAGSLLGVSDLIETVENRFEGTNCVQPSNDDAQVFSSNDFLACLPPDFYERNLNQTMNEMKNELVLFKMFKKFVPLSTPPTVLSTPPRPQTKSGLPLPLPNRRKNNKKRKIDTLTWIVGSEEYKKELQAIKDQKQEQENLKKQKAEKRKLNAKIKQEEKKENEQLKKEKAEEKKKLAEEKKKKATEEKKIKAAEEKETKAAKAKERKRIAAEEKKKENKMQKPAIKKRTRRQKVIENEQQKIAEIQKFILDLDKI